MGDSIDLDKTLVEKGTAILNALEDAYKVEGKQFTPEQIEKLNRIADDFRQQGKLNNALVCCKDSAKLVEDNEMWHKDPGKDPAYVEGLVHMHFGTVYLAYGEQKLEQAFSHYRISEEVFGNRSKHYCEAVALMAQGIVREVQGNWLDAWKYYDLSLNAFGISEPHNDSIASLKSAIKEKSERAQKNYIPVPPKEPTGVPTTQVNTAESAPSTMGRKSLFGKEWLQFINVADAIVILEPQSKESLSPLEKNLSQANELITRESSREEWNPLLKAIDDLLEFSSSTQSNRTLMRDLKKLVEKLVNKIIENLSIGTHPASVEEQLKARIELLRQT